MNHVVGCLAADSLHQTAITTACFGPEGSPEEVQRELMRRIIVSSAPSQSRAASFPGSRDKSAKAALDPSHCYAAQSWPTTSWYLICITANLKLQKRRKWNEILNWTTA